MGRSKKIVVIGSGFSGMSAAAYLTQDGYSVEVHEKNEQIGGRARVLKEDGFTFDMGPSWYWMPDVAEKFFNAFDKSAADFYNLRKLSPAFRIFFGKDDYWDIPSEPEALYDFFERTENGAARQLQKFMKQGAYKYEAAMEHLMHMPSLSWSEYMNWPLLKGLFRYTLFTSFGDHVSSYFKDKRLIQLMEFPMLFLGASPKKIPALYSLMNYSGFIQGTWYPMGGMHKIVDAMRQITEERGVKIFTSSEIKGFTVSASSIKNCKTNDILLECEAVVASADYHHVDQNLLPENYRSYSQKYWRSRTMAPSCLIFYLGVNKRIKNILHHNLFFDEDIEQHTREIYDEPKWPSRPLFYLCCPSKTDSSVAPTGCENLFFLMPISSGLADDPEVHNKYFNLLLDRVERLSGESIQNNIIYKKTYSINDFLRDYHAYRGNAYGLANTLFQTGILKPSMRSKKIKNLFFTGQLTVPGPGIPPCIISGKIAASEVKKFLN